MRLGSLRGQKLPSEEDKCNYNKYSPARLKNTHSTLVNTEKSPRRTQREIQKALVPKIIQDFVKTSAWFKLFSWKKKISVSALTIAFLFNT